MKRAVLLLSGGLDSATALAIAKSEGYEVYALSFRYGQRHMLELNAAANVASAFEVKEHKIADIDLRLFGGSALTDEIDVPKNRSSEDIGHGIPITYVPARNTIFLSFALAWAEVLKAYDIFIGVNALDYSLTISCYDPTPARVSCGTCDSCILRKKGFIEAGIPDPTKYLEG